MKHYSRIALIGNGFDLAHGLKTRYDDFAKWRGEDFFEPYRSLLTKYCGSDMNWCDFEESIRALTAQLLPYRITDDHDGGGYGAPEVNRHFDRLRHELAKYLTIETTGKRIHKIPSLNQYLTKRTLAINFNFSATADRYACDVIHIHGSLAENEIVLGYDYRDHGCLESYDEMKWAKAFCRDRLHFHRYLKERYSLSSDSAVYRAICNDYECYEAISHSGKGLEDEDCDTLKHADILKEYLRSRTSALQTPGVLQYSRINEIVVAGHSIVADQVYLTELMKKCRCVNKVIIFTHPGESPDDLKKRIDFFKLYCRKMTVKKYR